MATTISFKVAKKISELGYFAEIDTIFKTVVVFEKDGKCMLTGVMGGGNMRTTMECTTSSILMFGYGYGEKRTSALS